MLRNIKSRKVVLPIWLFLCLLVIVGSIYPVRSVVIRLVLCILVVLVFAGSQYLLIRRKILRFLPSGLGVLVLILYLLPGGRFSPAVLRNRVVANLESYEGTPYVWGGEGLLVSIVPDWCGVV